MIQTLFGSLKEDQEPERKSIFERMRQAVTRTRDSLGERIDGVLALTRTVDESALEELEMSLIASDIGVNTAAEIANNLRERAKRQQIQDGAELKELLKEELKAILDENVPAPKTIAAAPEVIMMVGVNGTGKTTTSGKLAAFYRARGKRRYCAPQIPSVRRPSSNSKCGASEAAWRWYARSREATPPQYSSTRYRWPVRARPMW